MSQIFASSRDFDVLPVSTQYGKCLETGDKSKHLKGRSVPRVSHVFADAKNFVVFLFPDTFRIQGILSFSCFQTLSVFKGFCPFPVSRHFPYSRDFVVSLFPDTFRNQWPPCHSVPPVCHIFLANKKFCCFSPVLRQFCCFSPVLRHFPYSMDFVVSLFPDTFRIQWILLFFLAKSV